MSVNEPAPPPVGSSGRSCATTFLAVAGFLAVSGVLLLLPTGFLGPVFIIGAILFFGLFTLHYLVWGRWLDAELRRSESQVDDRDPGPDS